MFDVDDTVKIVENICDKKYNFLIGKIGFIEKNLGDGYYLVSFEYDESFADKMFICDGRELRLIQKNTYHL